MKTLLLTLTITCLLFMAGCSSWEGNSTKQEFAWIAGEMRMVKNETVNAKQAQYFTDSSRTKMKFKIEGLGKASVGSSVLDAEEIEPVVVSILTKLGLLL